MSNLPEYDRKDDTYWHVRRMYCNVSNLTYGPMKDWNEVDVKRAVRQLDMAITAMLNEVAHHEGN